MICVLGGRAGAAAGAPASASRADIAASLTNLAQQLIQRGAGGSEAAGDEQEDDSSSSRVLSLVHTSYHLSLQLSMSDNILILL